MKRVHATLCALVLIAACTDNPVGIEAKTATFTKEPIGTQEVAADRIARALALAMKDATIRTAVRDAMRASPITEHKLRFQEFVQTPTGQGLLGLGAERIGISLQALQEIVAQLPPLDFYVPVQSQRRSWRGEATVRVGYFLDHDARNARAYDTNGIAVGLHDNLGVAGNATFVLAVAERTSRRIHSQLMVPNLVIEDADDGTLSGSVVDYLPDGTTRVTELADLYVEGPTTIRGSFALSRSGALATILAPTAPKYIIPCDEPGGLPCEPPPYSPPDTTFLQDVVILGVCDNYECAEGNEFEWHTYFSINTGSTWTDRRDVRIEGINSSADLRFHIPALFRKLRSNDERIQSDVVETDIWSDDHWVPSPQWSLLANNMMRFQGDGRCGFDGPFGRYNSDFWGPHPPYNYNCEYASHDGQAAQYYDWKQVNQSMIWNP